MFPPRVVEAVDGLFPSNTIEYVFSDQIAYRVYVFPSPPAEVYQLLIVEAAICVELPITLVAVAVVPQPVNVQPVRTYFPPFRVSG